MQISTEDTAQLGIADGDWVEVESHRSKVTEPARVGDVIHGTVLIPFHYGYWDNPERTCTANELTITEGDPVRQKRVQSFTLISLLPQGFSVDTTMMTNRSET